MTDDPHEWLLGEEAANLLAEVPSGPPTPALLERLRRLIGEDAPRRAAAIVELAELRRRAAAKFRLAPGMFFTRKSLEQATDERVARYKAARFAGRQSVIDVCTGIGGDLLGLADRQNAQGFEAEPLLAAYARRNLAVYGCDVPVHAERRGAESFPPCDAWHADPDRRAAGVRGSRPEAHDPPLATLAAWRVRQPAAAVKLAPAAPLPADWRAECELEWISRGGECRQQVAWCGPLAGRPGERRATRLEGDAEPATIAGLPTNYPEAAPTLGTYIYDPDPSVLAADLAGTLAHAVGIAPVAAGCAYLTGENPSPGGLLDVFRTVEAMPLRRERLAAWLAERAIGRLEVKCRGGAVSPERLRQELKPRGDRAATLIVYGERRGGLRVIVAER